MPLQVDENGAIGLALAPGPVVDAEHARGRASRQGQAADQAQHRVAARRHADPLQHARTRLTAHGNTNPALCRRQAVCALRPRRDKAGQPLDKGPPRARRIAAVQASQPQFEANLAAKAG
jgi:hypothetical protein